VNDLRMDTSDPTRPDARILGRIATHDKEPQMTRLNRNLALALTVSAFAGLGCDDGATGIALDFEPAVTTGALSSGIYTAGDFTATRLEALITEVKMLPDKDPTNEDKEAKFKAKGDFWIDALNPDDSLIPTVPLPAETYKKVEFKFEKPKSGNGLDGTDAAIALDATIGTDKVQVRISDSQKVTLRHVDGIALATGKTSTFLIDLDVPGWFTGVDLSKLDKDPEGVIHIDSKTNKGAYTTVTDNLKARIKLLRKP